MKRICALILLIIGMEVSSFAQKSILIQANDFYSAGNYSAAAEKYEFILLNEGVAPEIYYNLGNSYYKLNEVGLSILNYERAIRLNPLFEEAKINLSIAQTKVIDNVIEPPTFFIMSWLNGLIKLLSSNNWFYISLVLFILSIVLSFFFMFGSTTFIRKISFYFGITLLSVSVLALIFSGIRKNQLLNHHQAIIMSGFVVAKSSPDKSGTDLYQLHEGTKVTVKTDLGKWVEIVIGNGDIGWIEKSHLEKI